MNTTTRYRIASWCLAAVALFSVLRFQLLGALLAGLLVHELVHVAAPTLRLGGASFRTGKLIALVLLIVSIGLLVGGAVFGLIALLGKGQFGIADLLQKMAEVIETARGHFPDWVQPYLPSDADGLVSTVSQWLREHASELGRAGGEFGRMVVTTLIGMIIGGLIAFKDTRKGAPNAPLAQAIVERTTQFATAFRAIAFAQVRISALNTLFTFVYLLILLPLFGVHLPLAKTIVVVTFIAGLLPLIGNLISNTIIVIVSLSASLAVAVSSLVFLVVIHKLEYFVNARIIGSRIRSGTWELLLAILMMEAWFGLPGVVAAPFYYAYLKSELSAAGAI
jgi:predicted PurR-regulated permease PerM